MMRMESHTTYEAYPLSPRIARRSAWAFFQSPCWESRRQQWGVENTRELRGMAFQPIRRLAAIRVPPLKRSVRLAMDTARDGRPHEAVEETEKPPPGRRGSRLLQGCRSETPPT